MFSDTEKSLLPAAFLAFLDTFKTELQAVFQTHPLGEQMEFEEFALEVFDELELTKRNK